MINVTIKDANLRIDEPDNWKPSYGKCEALNLRREQRNGLPVLLSAWKPSSTELEILMRGGSIVLGVLGSVHPPVLMYASTED